MSVDQLPKPKQATRGDARLVQYDEYIDRQVENTRRVVKFVDLATSLVLLAGGVLAYLLVVAIAEHWLVPGGFSELSRLGLLLLLAWGVASFAFRRLWPLVIGRVNPIYAAHAIEVAAEGGPSLKNSLVNLLLFRQKRAEISDAVYHTLEEQAAQRLSRAPLDSAVDRTALIRFGYVLLAIVAIAGLYKVFSPKDPLVAARRVLMPWADIVPASRVKIVDVKPGVATVPRGEFVDVSAEVRGIGDDENVVLRFTTADGQAVNKSTPMKLSRDNFRYEGRLPADEPSASAGLSQDVSYRIEAGDARTLDYAVKVVDAPSILVERIEYDYPEYTGYLDREVKQLGDIGAIEGTRITIHARANGPIKEAHVDFDADGRRELTMHSRDANATASFVLALREDRRTPRHASYVLRFANRDGRPNRNPVKHSIHVEPDYAPEASILSPREKLVDVRLDETLAVEVEARDPDFALANVRLRGQVQGRDAFDIPLLKLAHQGKFTARHQFKPSQHGLKAGDVVDYWVAANDNRTPEPNSAQSPRQQFRVVSPDPQQPPPDRVAQRDPKNGEQQPQNGEAEKDKQQGQKQGQSKDGGEASRDPKASAEQQGEGDGERGREGDSNDAGKGGHADPKKSDQQDQRSGNQSQSDGKNSNDKQTGAGASGGEPSQGSRPAGARPDSNIGARQSDGGAKNGQPQQSGGESGQQQHPQQSEPSPVSSDGDNDGEAFERIQQHMQRTGQINDQSPSERQQRGGEGEKGRGGEPESEQKREQDRVSETDAGAKQQAGEKTGRQNQARDQNQGERKKTGEQPGEQTEGGGADTKSGEPQSAKKQPGDNNEQTKSPGGQQTSTKGESGADDEQKSQGSPDSQPNMKPTEKRQQQPSPDGDSNNEEPPAEARGKSESDSHGEQGGDRAGGGEEGGGQKAPRDGTGSAGQNQSADEGGGESGERGAGNNSPDAGSDAVADKKTGQSDGKTPGRGGKTRDVGDVQPKPGETPDPSQKQGDPLHRQAPTSEESKAPNKVEKDDDAGGKQGAGAPVPPKDARQSANQNGAPTGQGGEQGTAAMAPPRSTGTAPEGDQANLDYARKQTDLVLEKLSDQLNGKEVDKDLLKKLGWSEDELRKFVDRWRDRKQAAERKDEAGDSAKRELDEALRSLGLRRGPLKQGQVRDDSMRDLREGYRGPVPLEYQERLRAYNQGVSRAQAEVSDEIPNDE